MVKRFIKERLGTIILFAIIIIFVTWGFLRVKEARDNAITYVEDYEAPEGNVDFTQEGSYVSVAKTDSLELFYNEAKGAIQVMDLKSNHLWKGICDNEVYDLEGVNAQWKAYLQSPITISFNDLKKKDSGVTKQFAGKDCGWLEAEIIPNGVAVTYGFLTPGIYVTVEYTLEGDEFVVRIPHEKIVEKSKYALTTVELLPFFGASDNSVDGYLFYPDGSGAITTYEKVDTRPSNVKAAWYYTYTNKTVNFPNLWNRDAYMRYTAAMPIYGIKNGDHALFGIFTEGAENSGVVVYPSGYIVDLNHMGFEVYTRNVYVVDMYSMSTGLGTASTGGSVQRVDKKIIPEDKVARFCFLSGDEASYSGMANVYREYLLANGMIKDAIADGEEMALALGLLMGTTKEGMVFDEYVSMTNFEQVQEILDRLSERGITNKEVVLESWIKGYDRYETWGPVRQLGGTGGLKALNSYMEANPENKIYLENGFMFASSETSGLAEDTDVAYDGLNVEISVQNMDGTVLYMMNPQAAYRRNQEFLSKMEKYGNLGVAYNDVGKYVYADFNPQAPFTKAEAVLKLRELLGSAADSGRRVASLGTNQYVYSYTDYLYNLQEESYGLSITDYAVPFIQMVVSGLIPYSTQGAGNLSYDLQIQKLKWVEYGGLPNFVLTYESAQKLRDTGYDSLFSSTYADWEDTVVETYLEFKERLSGTYGQQMTSHEILTDDLIRIEYENGTVVYVNYSNEEATVDGVTIPAKDYVAVGGGAK